MTQERWLCILPQPLSICRSVNLPLMTGGPWKFDDQFPLLIQLELRAWTGNGAMNVDVLI